MIQENLNIESKIQSKKLLSFQDMTNKEYIIFIICFLLSFFYNAKYSICSIKSSLFFYIILILFSLYKFSFKKLLFTLILGFSFFIVFYKDNIVSFLYKNQNNLFLAILNNILKYLLFFINFIQQFLNCYVIIIILLLFILIFFNLNINIPYIYILLGLLFGFALNVNTLTNDLDNILIALKNIQKESIQTYLLKVIDNFYFYKNPIINLLILFIGLYFFRNSTNLFAFFIFFFVCSAFFLNNNVAFKVLTSSYLKTTDDTNFD